MPSGSLTLEDLTRCGWTTVIEGADKRENWHYFQCFNARAKEAHANGQETCRQVFTLLAEVCSLTLKVDAVEEPFQPSMVTWQGRTAAVEDFDDDVLALLAMLAPTVSDAELRARLADLVWVAKRKDYRLALTAVRAYLASARMLEASGAWSEMEERLERAVRLAKSLGRKNQAFIEAITAVEAALDRHDTMGGWKILAAQLMSVLLEHSVGDPEKYAPLSGLAARRALREGDWRRAGIYWRIKAD